MQRAEDPVHTRQQRRKSAAPALLALEIMNVCATRARREPQREAALLGLVPVFEAFHIRQQAVDPGGVLRLAIAARLTACDAAYLWLARHLGAPLVTLDARLAAASA